MNVNLSTCSLIQQEPLSAGLAGLSVVKGVKEAVKLLAVPLFLGAIIKDIS